MMLTEDCRRYLISLETSLKSHTENYKLYDRSPWPNLSNYFEGKMLATKYAIEMFKVICGRECE